MADWMNQMANAVEEAEAANARAQEEVPTEPAITPRSQLHDAPGSTRLVEELQLPSLEYGPHPEPERFAIRYILNDGSMPQEEYEELARKAAMAFNNRDMERERRRAEAAEHEAHERSIKEWDAQIQAQGLDTIQHFQVVPLLKVFHRSVYFQESMRPFVRMIQALPHTHSQL